MDKNIAVTHAIMFPDIYRSRVTNNLRIFCYRTTILNYRLIYIVKKSINESKYKDSFIKIFDDN